MADVKICDRCGKTIVPSAAQRFGFGSWKYSIIQRIPCSQGTIAEWDLCPDCGEKLSRFLKGEELVHDSQGSKEGESNNGYD